MALWYDKKAYALLKKCSDARDLTEWNAYRKETNYVPINLRFANLRGFYLVDADLRDVDFRGANLYGAKCHLSDVWKANIGMQSYWKIYWILIFLSLLFILGRYMSEGEIGIIQRDLINLLFISFIAGLLPIDLFRERLSSASKSIAYAKNPEEAIGFDAKYLKDITIPLSTRSDKEIAVVKELLAKEEDKKEKLELQNKLEELQKEKETVLLVEAHAKTQQIKIQNALNHILKPYEYMERNISKLRKHNYFS